MWLLKLVKFAGGWRSVGKGKAWVMEKAGECEEEGGSRTSLVSLTLMWRSKNKPSCPGRAVGPCCD